MESEIARTRTEDTGRDVRQEVGIPLLGYETWKSLQTQPLIGAKTEGIEHAWRFSGTTGGWAGTLESTGKAWHFF